MFTTTVSSLSRTAADCSSVGHCTATDIIDRTAVFGPGNIGSGSDLRKGLVTRSAADYTNHIPSCNLHSTSLSRKTKVKLGYELTKRVLNFGAYLVVDFDCS